MGHEINGGDDDGNPTQVKVLGGGPASLERVRFRTQRWNSRILTAAGEGKENQNVTTHIIISSDEIRTSTCVRKGNVTVIEQNIEAYARLCGPPLPGYRCLPASPGRKVVVFKIREVDGRCLEMTIRTDGGKNRSPARAPSTSSNKILTRVELH